MTVAQVRILIVAGASVLNLAVGLALLQSFADGDQRFLLGVFTGSALGALVWLALRGLPQSTPGWLILIAIAFGPAFMLGAYIAAVLATSP